MNLRKTPTYLALLMIAITLARVAHFADAHMHAGLLGWVFALCLGASVFFVSMQTKEHITIKENAKEDRRSSNARLVAWVVLIPVLLADGLFNLADTLAALDANPNTTILVAAWVYGLFPTLLAAGLGMLQGYLDRLPTPPQKRVHPMQTLTNLLYARLMQTLEPPMQATQAPVQLVVATPAKVKALPVQTEAAQIVTGLLATCRACGWESNKTYATERAKSNAIAAHSRACKPRKNGHIQAPRNGSGKETK